MVEFSQLPPWQLQGFISHVLADLDEEVPSFSLHDLASKADCLAVCLPMQSLLIFSSLHHLWEKTWGTVMSVLSHLALTMSSSLDNSYLGLSLLSQIPPCFPCSTLSCLCWLWALPIPSFLHLLSCFSKLLFSPLLPKLSVSFPRQCLCLMHPHFEMEQKV